VHKCHYFYKLISGIYLLVLLLKINLGKFFCLFFLLYHWRGIYLVLLLIDIL